MEDRGTATIRFVAIGDSFTEGVGDDLPDGRVRGWADLAAQGWADAIGADIEYANLAIRGKLIVPIVEEQLEAALALKPTHLSFNGGGNDILRPRTSIAHVADMYTRVLDRCQQEGVQLVALSGANPAAQLPLHRLIQRRGDALAAAVDERLAHRSGVITAWNWPDRELSAPAYWSPDRLHMNARGHHRVAARFLTAVGVPAPTAWWSLPEVSDAMRPKGMAYYRRYVFPWVKRRLTHTSSGDGRLPKFADWTRTTPAPA